jgi:hypothetical protein
VIILSKKLITFLLTLLLSVLLPLTSVNAAVKVGGACPKAGITSFASGKTYTCLKSGKKFVWDKGALGSKSSTKIPEVMKIDYSKAFSTDQGFYTEFTGPCELDTKITGQLAEIQSYFYNLNRCAGQLRINKYELGKNRPSSVFNPLTQFANTEPCKIVTPKESRMSRGFTTDQAERNRYEALRKFPSPNAVIQLVPIYSSDSATPKNSPADDYASYLKLIKDWLEYSADFPSLVEIRIPKNYIKMDSKLGDYKIFHENRSDSPNHVAFNKDLVAATDSSIDYQGVNIAIVVPPAGTDAAVFSQASIGSLQTNEGFVALGMTESAHLANMPTLSKFSNLGHPFWWIHEMFHSGVGFDDHYGDSLSNINTEYGMGRLTLMTPFGGDLTTWEKWRLGFIKDSQVQCVSSGTTSTHWIAPSTVQTSESKSIVIRISATRVVVIETLRPAGLYYKLPIQSQGALVYEVDVLEAAHGLGMKLSLPIGRIVTSDPFFMASYPLKKGESTITNGYKVTIVESGNFGDVVKVERVA